MSPKKIYYVYPYDVGGSDLLNNFSLNVNGMLFTNTGLSSGSNPLTMTFSVWAKLPVGSGTVIVLTQAVLPNLAGSGFIRLTNEGGRWFFLCYTNEDPPPAGGQTLWRDRVVTTFGFDYRDDQWHQIVVTMDAYNDRAEDMKIYVDGVDRTSINQSEGDTTRPTPWSMASSDTTFGNTSSVSGARIAQMAYWDSLVSVSDLWNSGAVQDLNALSSAPLEWHQFDNNLNNSGSTGVDGVLTTGTASYSTDVPPS